VRRKRRYTELAKQRKAEQRRGKPAAASPAAAAAPVPAAQTVRAEPACYQPRAFSLLPTKEAARVHTVCGYRVHSCIVHCDLTRSIYGTFCWVVDPSPQVTEKLMREFPFVDLEAMKVVLQASG
jgi:hypothetical protein